MAAHLLLGWYPLLAWSCWVFTQAFPVLQVGHWRKFCQTSWLFRSAPFQAVQP